MARSDMITEILEDYGYEPERYTITWVSSAEPDRFVKAVTEMTDRLRKMGPIRDDAQAI
jgi:coenzyme F420-reducing hydrogenase delta subunit